jgi:hypothetical protein
MVFVVDSWGHVLIVGVWARSVKGVAYHTNWERFSSGKKIAASAYYGFVDPVCVAVAGDGEVGVFAGGEETACRLVKVAGIGERKYRYPSTDANK